MRRACTIITIRNSNSKFRNFQKRLKLDSQTYFQNFQKYNCHKNLRHCKTIFLTDLHFDETITKPDTFESICTNAETQGEGEGVPRSLPTSPWPLLMQIRRKKLACFQRVLIIQATTFRNEIRTRASPLPATSVSLMAASSPVIYIIRIPCRNASESTGKKGEERKVDAEKLAFLGDGRKLRERHANIYTHTERKKCIYTHWVWKLSSTRTMSSGCLLETFQTKRRQSRNLG